MHHPYDTKKIGEAGYRQSPTFTDHRHDPDTQCHPLKLPSPYGTLLCPSLTIIDNDVILLDDNCHDHEY